MAERKKIKVDGKGYYLDEFDDSRSWGKRKKRDIKNKSSSLPNILGKT